MMNTLNENELLTIENEYWVNLWNDLEYLKSIPQFKRLILKGYFIDKAVNGVSLLANDATIAQNKRSAVMEDLIAISSLQDFFIMVENLGSIPPESDDESDQLDS